MCVSVPVQVFVYLAPTLDPQSYSVSRSKGKELFKMIQ